MAESKTAEVKLEGYLARYAPGEWVNVAADQSVAEMALGLGIPPRQPLIALANGKTVDLEYRIAQGDRVRLFAPISGGGGKDVHGELKTQH